jgi:NAD(P)-dependent dehydrogenase (short-subunit alcohol dehydrogenase family)
MPTIAIVGAGPGLGRSIGKVFGRKGFRVALVARSRDTLDRLAADLGEEGIEAAGFPADIMDRASLAETTARIKERFGAIDVLEYSPAPHNSAPALAMTGALDVTVDNVAPQLDLYLNGAITMVRAVLPDMLDAGSGTLLFTTGGSSVDANPMMGNVGIAMAALRNFVLSLHQALGERGIYVAHVPISVWIGQMGPASEPDVIAQLYWELYTTRRLAERPYRFADPG